MAFVDDISKQLMEAMKARDEAKVSTLRMIKAALGAQAIQKGKDKLDDAESIDVLGKLLKQREESIEAFTKGNRPELAEKERKEAEILKGYLPAQMSEAELKSIVEAAVKELGVSGPQALGAVMKAVMPKVAGRADGKTLNQLVRQTLGGSS
jgi:uncharacterized protein YqeY